MPEQKLIESPHVKSVLEDLSKNSQQNYLASLRQLLRFLNSKEDLEKEVTIEDVVGEAKTNIKKTQEHLDTLYVWLQNNKVDGYTRRNIEMKESSANQRAYGYLRGFFVNLDVAFEKKWAKRIPKVKKVNQAIKKDRIYTFYDVDEKTKTIHFNREFMQEFLTNLKLRDIAITLALLSSSQDTGDLFNLTVGDIREQKNKTRIFLVGTRNKTSVVFRTFLSKEATRFVRKYLEQERGQAKSTDPLFVYRRFNGNGEEEKSVKPASIASIYREVAKKMGVKWGKGEYNPLRPKRMRHLFRTACDTAGIPELYVNAFMGHRNHMGQSYSELSKAKLELEYLRVEPFLTVYGQSKENMEIKEDIRLMETRILDLNKEVTEQKIKNVELEAQIKNIYNYIQKNLDPVLDTFTALIETPEGMAALDKIPGVKASRKRKIAEILDKEKKC